MIPWRSRSPMNKFIPSAIPCFRPAARIASEIYPLTVMVRCGLRLGTPACSNHCDRHAARKLATSTRVPGSRSAGARSFPQPTSAGAAIGVERISANQAERV